MRDYDLLKAMFDRDNRWYRTNERAEDNLVTSAEDNETEILFTFKDNGDLDEIDVL